MGRSSRRGICCCYTTHIHTYVINLSVDLVKWHQGLDPFIDLSFKFLSLTGGFLLDYCNFFFHQIMPNHNVPKGFSLAVHSFLLPDTVSRVRGVLAYPPGAPPQWPGNPKKKKKRGPVAVIPATDKKKLYCRSNPLIPPLPSLAWHLCECDRGFYGPFFCSWPWKAWQHW